MRIAIIGTGNVGGALATKWSKAGHQLLLGVKDFENFKGKHLLRNPNTSVHSVEEAVAQSEVVLIATPAKAAVEVAQSLGNTEGKVIIDSMNVIQGNGPLGFSNSSDALLQHTQTDDLAKCFNTTGFNNMIDPVYQEHQIDAFVCGDSKKAKDVAGKLALDAGFGVCYDVGGNDKFQLMEQFAFFWINLAIMQGQGREIGFKLLRR